MSSSQSQQAKNNSRHHLIFTRKAWGDFPLRGYHLASIKLKTEVHVKFHEENEPFWPVSPEAKEYLRKALLGLQFRNNYDVLKNFEQACSYVLKKHEGELSYKDCKALRANAKLARSHIAWLDKNAPGWGSQKRTRKPRAKSARSSSHDTSS